MSIERPKSSKRAETLLWSILGTVVTGLAFGGWAARDYIEERLASKEDVVVAGVKADYALDQQMAALIAQISYLERKKNKSAEEINQLDYLRNQLQIMRNIRKGK